MECNAFGTGHCKTLWASHGCLEVITSPPHTGRHRHLAHQCYHRRCVLRCGHCFWQGVCVGWCGAGERCGAPSFNGYTNIHMFYNLARSMLWVSADPR